MPPSTASAACLAPRPARSREPTTPRLRREPALHPPASTAFRSPISTFAFPPPDAFPAASGAPHPESGPTHWSPGGLRQVIKEGLARGPLPFLGRCLQAQCSVLCL